MTKQYVEPETVTETFTETKPVDRLAQRDVLASSGQRVAKVVHGHKYVTIMDGHGRTLFRETNEDAAKREVLVTVERETEESREATRRYDSNLAIIRELERYESKYQQAVAHFNNRWAEWGELNYDFLGGVMDAEADRKLWARFAAHVDYELTQGGDHVDALTSYVESLKDSIIGYSGRIRGISRSTNRLSNLMEDIETEHMITFIREARWYGVK